MSKWNKGLMTAMEEFEESSQSAVTGMGERFENVLEIQESARSISQFSDSMSEAVQGAHDLHEMSELISTECDCEAAMEIAHISVESIYKRLGISQRILPSLEDYKDKVALEFIGKAVSSIWNAIKAAFIKLYEMIKGFFNWLFGFSKSADQKLSSAKEETAKISTNKPTVEITIKPAGTNTTEETASNTDEQSIMADVRSGEHDAVIQATVQQTVLHDPNHAADPAAQQEIHEAVQEVTDKIKNGVVVAAAEDVDKVIDSNIKPVVCGKKVYIPISHMNAGHYITFLAKNNGDPEEIINSLDSLSGIFLIVHNALSNLIHDLHKTKFDDKEVFLDSIYKSSNGITDKFNDINTYLHGQYEVTQRMVDVDSDFSVAYNKLQKIEKGNFVKLHAKIRVPTKEELEKIETILERVIKNSKDYQNKFNSLMDLYNKAVDVLDSLPQDHPFGNLIIGIFEFVNSNLTFAVADLLKHIQVDVVKAATRYVTQANNLYKKKMK